jgi:hypothetical protein
MACQYQNRLSFGPWLTITADWPTCATELASAGPIDPAAPASAAIAVTVAATSFLRYAGLLLR